MVCRLSFSPTGSKAGTWTLWVHASSFLYADEPFGKGWAPIRYGDCAKSTSSSLASYSKKVMDRSTDRYQDPTMCGTLVDPWRHTYIHIAFIIHDNDADQFGDQLALQQLDGYQSSREENASYSAILGPTVCILYTIILLYTYKNNKSHTIATTGLPASYCSYDTRPPFKHPS